MGSRTNQVHAVLQSKFGENLKTIMRDNQILRYEVAMNPNYYFNTELENQLRGYGYDVSFDIDTSRISIDLFKIKETTWYQNFFTSIKNQGFFALFSKFWTLVCIIYMSYYLYLRFNF